MRYLVFTLCISLVACGGQEFETDRFADVGATGDVEAEGGPDIPILGSDRSDASDDRDWTSTDANITAEGGDSGLPDSVDASGRFDGSTGDASGETGSASDGSNQSDGEAGMIDAGIADNSSGDACDDRCSCLPDGAAGCGIPLCCVWTSGQTCSGTTQLYGNTKCTDPNDCVIGGPCAFIDYTNDAALCTGVVGQCQ